MKLRKRTRLSSFLMAAIALATLLRGGAPGVSSESFFILPSGDAPHGGAQQGHKRPLYLVDRVSDPEVTNEIQMQNATDALTEAISGIGRLQGRVRHKPPDQDLGDLGCRTQLCEVVKEEVKVVEGKLCVRLVLQTVKFIPGRRTPDFRDHAVIPPDPKEPREPGWKCPISLNQNGSECREYSPDEMAGALDQHDQDQHSGVQ